MKLLMVILAIGLSTADKLNKGYLPPPGAKLAGGNSGDLQTPLEFPKQYPVFGTENGNSPFKEPEKQRADVINGNPKSYDTKIKSEPNGFSSDAIGKPNGYTQTTAYPNGFETRKPLVPNMGYNNAYAQNTPPGFGNSRNPKQGSPTQEGTRDGFGARDYHYGKPGNMPIIGVTEGIMENYQPNAFGMYGGNPMIIKSYLPQDKPNNMLVENNGNHLNQPQRDRLSYEKTGSGQKSDVTVTMRPNFGRKPATYQPNTVTPVLTGTSNINRRTETQKTHQKRPERPQAESDKNAVILNYETDLTPEGYSYSFDTSNGIHMDESATLVDGVKALGSYSYTGDDGKFYSVIYSADENGFQPRGDHLPTPPPIPAAIQKVIDQANRDKEAGIFHDGSYDEQKYGHMKYQGPVNRYLQNMQESPKLKNRERVLIPKKMQAKPILDKNIKAKYYVDGKVKPDMPVNNFNGQFGMRRVSPVEQSREYPKAILNGQYNGNYRLEPMRSLDKYENIKQMNKPDLSKYRQPDKVALKNKAVQSPDFSLRNKVANKLNPFNNLSATKPYLYQTGMDKTQDASYYYVPPRTIFVEGRTQNKLPTLKKPNQFGTTDGNDTTNPNQASGFYYLDQRDNNKKLSENPSKTTDYNYFVNTEEPDINKKTDERDFYGSTIHDVNDLGIVSTLPPKGMITTPKSYGNTMSTIPYDTENTKDIDYQEETIFPEQNENVPLTRSGQDTAELSTTPMPSTNYVSILGETSNPSTDFDSPTNAVKYSDNQGYISTIPETPFDGFPSSTYTPNYTNVGTQTEPISNVQVDGFGRPIQDSSLFKDDSASFEYYTTKIPQNDEQKTTATYYDDKNQFTDKATSPKSEYGLSDIEDFSEQGKPTDFDRTKTTNRIIGEDFSGPQQQQGYDPATGYFY